MFQSSTQPLCRCCAKPIPKRAEGVYPRGITGGGGGIASNDTGLYSKADCQALTNGIVLAVGYSYETDSHYERTGKRWVHKYTVWDGETYEDEFFCGGTCVQRFARVMARAGNMTVAYQKARDRQREPEHV